jgi:hypothetical protein
VRNVESGHLISTEMAFLYAANVMEVKFGLRRRLQLGKRKEFYLEERDMQIKSKKSIGMERTVKYTKPPHLVPIDLGKLRGCKHPDIKESLFYLVQYDGNFHAGTFSKEWYGWSFDGIYDAGTQLDDPYIQAIWQIIPEKKPEKVKIILNCETKDCKGELEQLGSCYGDPEGIREDMWCPICKTIWGCTKAAFHKMGKSETKPVR